MKKIIIIGLTLIIALVINALIISLFVKLSNQDYEQDGDRNSIIISNKSELIDRYFYDMQYINIEKIVVEYSNDWPQSTIFVEVTYNEDLLSEVNRRLHDVTQKEKEKLIEDYINKKSDKYYVSPYSEKAELYEFSQWQLDKLMKTFDIKGDNNKIQLYYRARTLKYYCPEDGEENDEDPFLYAQTQIYLIVFENDKMIFVLPDKAKIVLDNEE